MGPRYKRIADGITRLSGADCAQERGEKLLSEMHKLQGPSVDGLESELCAAYSVA
jgi:hypothetical protein